MGYNVYGALRVSAFRGRICYFLQLIRTAPLLPPKQSTTLGLTTYNRSIGKNGHKILPRGFDLLHVTTDSFGCCKN